MCTTSLTVIFCLQFIVLPLLLRCIWRTVLEKFKVYSITLCNHRRPVRDSPHPVSNKILSGFQGKWNKTGCQEAKAGTEEIIVTSNNMKIPFRRKGSTVQEDHMLKPSPPYFTRNDQVPKPSNWNLYSSTSKHTYPPLLIEDWWRSSIRETHYSPALLSPWWWTLQ